MEIDWKEAVKWAFINSDWSHVSVAHDRTRKSVKRVSGATETFIAFLSLEMTTHFLDACCQEQS